MAESKGDNKMKFPEYFTEDCFKQENKEVLQKKVEALVAAMTNDEKAELCHGGMNPPEVGQVANGGYLRGVPRLGVPEIRMYDGPAGVTSIYDTTGLPAEEMLASTWSRELAGQYGKVSGSENKMISGNCQLGAELDLVRTTHFNRSRDMLGEDPYLAGELAVPLVKGIQNEHVMATIKHFAGYVVSANPADTSNTNIDEQTLHELYLTPFERAITEADAAGVMTAYNRINGPYAANAEPLLKDVLRNQWQYDGLVMCDWGGNHRFSLDKGMDIEMPFGAYNSTERIKHFLETGKLKQQTLDDAVRHVLTAMGKVGYLSLVTLDNNGEVLIEVGREMPIRMPDVYAQKETVRFTNAAIAEDVAVKGAVLLKNEQQALPIVDVDLSDLKSVALIGLGGQYPICGYGQERSYGTLSYMKSPAQMLKALSGKPEAFCSQIGLDAVGTLIPECALYQNAEGDAQGLKRFYGITKEDGYRPPAMSMGGEGVEFTGVATKDEDADDDEGTLDFAPEELFKPGSDAADMEGFETGTLCSVDQVLEYVCSPGNYTYKNDSHGHVLKKGESYTWKGYIETKEAGEYQFNLQAIGGVAVFKMDSDGTGYKDMGIIKLREGAQWPWGNLVCTPEGMEVCATRVQLEANKRYPIVVYGKAMLEQKNFQIRLAWVTPTMRKLQYDTAIKAAETAKKTVMFVHEGFRMAYGQANGGMSFTEGTDLSLEAEQEKLLRDVAKACHSHDGKLIVAAYNGSTFAMQPWIDEVDALMYLWMPGQSGGKALARLLLGQDNPSGKLPQSFPGLNEDTPVTDTKAHEKERWYGVREPGKPVQINASEGMFTGYRWFEYEGRKPLFEFGFGLSYTTFEYSHLNIEVQSSEASFGVTGEAADFAVKVAFDVTNTGDVAGSEIAQVYISGGKAPAYVMVPEKQLCGFARLEDMQPGEVRHVEIEIPKRKLMYWDIKAELKTDNNGVLSKWKVAGGSRKIMVGASSLDIRLEDSIKI